MSPWPATLRRALLPAAILLGIIALWELITYLRDVPPWLLPAPSQIGATFIKVAPVLGPHLVRTLAETALGFGLALATGVVLAVAIDQWEIARRAIYPLLVTTQTVPIIALAPLLAIWFGFGILPKVLIVALVCFFPIVVSLAAGFRSADPEMLNLVRSMGARPAQIFTKVKVPAAAPSLLAGMKIAATYSVIGAVIAEWVGASEGLGIYMLRSSHSFKTDQVFVVIAVIVALSVALFWAIDLLGRLVAPWEFARKESEL